MPAIYTWPDHFEHDRFDAEPDPIPAPAPTYMPVAANALLPNTFGVELEFTTRQMDWSRHSPERIVPLLQHHVNIAGRISTFSPIRLGSRTSNGTAWDVKYDGSCGLEVASPALSWPKWEEVATITAALRGERATVNHQCGLHVHHHFPDLNNRQLRRMWLLWAAFENAIYAMLPSSRRNNDYCRSLLLISDNNRWNGLRNCTSPIRRFPNVVENNDRYRTLNMTHWWRTARIEVRVHHGTLDEAEIKNWTLFTQELLHAATSVSLQRIGAFSRLTIARKLTAMADLITQRSTHPDVRALPVYIEDAVRSRHPERLSTVC